MKAEDLIVGNRYYHFIFGWCKLRMPPSREKAVVLLEADEIEYYVMGNGYVKYSRDKETGEHILYTPIKDLLIDDKQELTSNDLLARAALNPKLTFWDK